MGEIERSSPDHLPPDHQHQHGRRRVGGCLEMVEIHFSAIRMIEWMKNVMMTNLANRSLRMAVSAITTVGTLPRCTVNT